MRCTAIELAIEVKDISKNYGSKQVVSNVSLSVKKGEIFGILGPNGAGKTTTIEMIEGIRHRETGNISVLGMDPSRHGATLKQKIGIQFQATSLQNNIRVHEALELFSSFYSTYRDLSELIEQLDLTEYLNKSFSDLSGGCKQRLMIALAVIHNPEVIFLDEPSTGLDPKARNDLWKFLLQLKSEKKTIILTTHYMEEARHLCDRVAMFHQGNILAIDTPLALANQYCKNEFIQFNSTSANIDLIKKLSAVHRVEQGDITFKVYGNCLQDISLQLFQLAYDKNWSITNFTFVSGTLEDLFITLVQGEKNNELNPTS